MRFATFFGEIIISFGPIIALLILWEKQDREEFLRQIKERSPGPMGAPFNVRAKRRAIGLAVFIASVCAAKLL